MSSRWSSLPIVPDTTSCELFEDRTNNFDASLSTWQGVSSCSSITEDSECCHWKKAIKRPVRFSAQLCKAFLTPVWCEAP